ncbi:WXG100 family type VII secretion target [Streptomyces sp. NPDC059679]|uniref:WXG100 family type VII secretion target n=1 Tax=Streptomyces sp. NPDC059679 TaxID=3346903 RepID=UPI00367F25DE
MSSLRGGNLEEMRLTAKMFTENLDKLNGIISALNSRTVGSEHIWTGSAADRFARSGPRWNGCPAVSARSPGTFAIR